MPIKLIALDLDGTLLNAKKEISRANKEALQAARAQGVKVVITTGRPLPAVELFLKELDLMGGEEYSITFNGGLVQTNDGGILDEIGFGSGNANTTEASSAIASGSVKLGKRFGKNFYVTYEKGLDATMGTLYFFFDISRKLKLRAQTGQQSALDLIYTVNYD